MKPPLDIEFNGEPPPVLHQSARDRWEALADAARSRPGEWASVEMGKPGAAGHARERMVKRGLKAIVRGSRVYVRTPE